MDIDPNATLQQLIQAALAPHKAQNDAGRVELPDISKLIEADKYIRGLVSSGAVTATANGPDISASLTVSQAGRTWGIGFARFIPPASP